MKRKVLCVARGEQFKYYTERRGRLGTVAIPKNKGTGTEEMHTQQRLQMDEPIQEKTSKPKYNTHPSAFHTLFRIGVKPNLFRF